MRRVTRLPMVAIFLWALVAPASTSATTLNPPPPDYERCQAEGNQTICHGQHVLAAVGDPTGIFCGSGPDEFEIVDHPDTLMGESTRWYDADGNLVARKIHRVYLRSEWTNPIAGTAVSYRQSVTYSDVFGVPGDLGTAAETHHRRRQLRGARPRSNCPKRRSDGVLVRRHARVPRRTPGVHRLLRRRRPLRPPAALRRARRLKRDFPGSRGSVVRRVPSLPRGERRVTGRTWVRAIPAHADSRRGEAKPTPSQMAQIGIRIPGVRMLKTVRRSSLIPTNPTTT